MLLKAYNKFKSLANIRLGMILPYVFFAFIFIVLPLILLFFKAVLPVLDEDGKASDNFVLIKNSTTWKIMWRSVWLGILTAFICLVIALPYSFFISTIKSKFFKIYAISLIVSPLIIFTISKIFSLRVLFVMIFDEPTINNEIFMLIGLIYLNLPFMIIPLYTVFSDMPKNILEASADLGYNKFWTLIKVVLPYGLKAIFSGIALVFLMAATSIIISDKLLPSGSQKQLIGNLINNSSNPSNPFDLAKVSSLVLITIVVLYSVYGLIYIFPLILSKLKGVKYE
ncbi:ABC transporter permease [Mesomycoplasma neurolyticum]|uniref:Polyamine (Spermidine/putrescine) ABC transporter permease n=1 Tax=Mesomycoplasma neurolyticum TaxID=2120 RepID=A0A449A5C7_9BACT|nr:ABC transporter permease [Mesomycoplasma neurolyticum]VEU59424.1 polyamine (spermidine/putrescine) ABC transporter permease [Mesomycoplasma neurolyticum]